MKSMNGILEKSSGHRATILAELNKLKATGKKYFNCGCGNEHKRITIDRAIELFEKLQ